MAASSSSCSLSPSVSSMSASVGDAPTRPGRFPPLLIALSEPFFCPSTTTCVRWTCYWDSAQACGREMGAAPAAALLPQLFCRLSRQHCMRGLLVCQQRRALSAIGLFLTEAMTGVARHAASRWAQYGVQGAEGAHLTWAGPPQRLSLGRRTPRCPWRWCCRAARQAARTAAPAAPRSCCPAARMRAMMACPHCSRCPAPALTAAAHLPRHTPQLPGHTLTSAAWPHEHARWCLRHFPCCLDWALLKHTPVLEHMLCNHITAGAQTPDILRCSIRKDSSALLSRFLHSGTKCVNLAMPCDPFRTASSSWSCLVATARMRMSLRPAEREACKGLPLLWWGNPCSALANALPGLACVPRISLCPLH